MKNGEVIVLTVRGPYNQVRGNVQGTLEAFDKHWNMILSNATETLAAPASASDEDVGTQAEKTRFFPVLFLKGDSVITARLVPANPGTDKVEASAQGPIPTQLDLK